MRYRLRTLMIMLAILPPILGISYVRWQRYRERQRRLKTAIEAIGAIQWQEIDWQALMSPSTPPPPADNSN